MHLALVQTLYRAKKSREVREFPLTALYCAVADGVIGRPVHLFAHIAPRKGLNF